ncbi:hypothetical protein ACIBVL_06110 [Streptomyces sp. NPDC049687]|uniref:hypothetical protein n=1 Tax=Streptomyces sp. NPDC049687 TaxID=3365596 RepID=UPI0037999F02
MPKNQKRVTGPLLVVVSVVTAGTLLAGCSSDSSDSSTENVGTSSNSANKAFQQALAYSKCMRENGLSSFPDPKQDSQGRIMLQPAEGVDPNSTAYQEAASACQSLNPQGTTGDSAGGQALDPAKVAKWAKCLRENGLPNFQDPQINGNSMLIDAGAAGITGPEDPKFAKAAQACYSIRPGGMLGFMGGGPR